MMWAVMLWRTVRACTSLVRDAVGGLLAERAMLVFPPPRDGPQHHTHLPGARTPTPGGLTDEDPSRVGNLVTTSKMPVAAGPRSCLRRRGAQRNRAQEKVIIRTPLGVRLGWPFTLSGRQPRCGWPPPREPANRAARAARARRVLACRASRRLAAI